jgi:hypothetical protein
VHLLSLEEPRVGAAPLEKELTDPGGELGFHLGTEMVLVWEAGGNSSGCYGMMGPGEVALSWEQG